MKIYISHSVGCATWDMEAIFQGTSFQTACRTMRYREKDYGKVKMLDWDYLEWKKFPGKVKEKHLRLVKEHDFEVVMSMDYWGYNRIECLNYTDELQKYTDRVLIPVHTYTPELKEYELAYPNANWFKENSYVPAEYRSQITHLLGGSPQAQKEKITTTQLDMHGQKVSLPNIESVDGNQIFNVSIRAGKYWSPLKPYWCKPKKKMTNEEIFQLSVKNVEQYWN